MQFNRHQLIKFAAKATGPSSTDLYGSLVQGGSYADRIAGLNPKKIPYSDRLYMAGSPEGQALAAKYNVDVSPSMLSSMSANRRQQQQMMASGPSPKAAPMARAAAAPVPQEGQAPIKLDIKMPARVLKQEAAMKAKQRVTPGAPAAAPVPSPAAPAAAATGATFPEAAPIDTSKPVVF